MGMHLPALAPFLLGCPQVKTLGIRPSLMAYTLEEKKMMRCAGLILFPSILHARTFLAAGICTFPNFTTYSYRSSRLHQVMLFKMVGIPHPRTKVYYGKKRESDILRDFALPFLAACPSNTTHQGILKIVSPKDFQACCERWNPLIVQEITQWETKLKLICTNYKIIGALCLEGGPYRRVQLQLDPSQLEKSGYAQPLKMTQRLLKAAQLDDICVEWALSVEGWRILGLTCPPVHIPTSDGTMNRFTFLCNQIAGGGLRTSPPPLKWQWGLI